MKPSGITRKSDNLDRPTSQQQATGYHVRTGSGQWVQLEGPDPEHDAWEIVKGIAMTALIIAVCGLLLVMLNPLIR